jgi:hypothetical protein
MYICLGMATHSDILEFSPDFGQYVFVVTGRRHRFSASAQVSTYNAPVTLPHQFTSYLSASAANPSNPPYIPPLLLYYHRIIQTGPHTLTFLLPTILKPPIPLSKPFEHNGVSMGDLLPTLSLLCCFCCDKKDPDEERYDFEEGFRKGSRIKPISEADERRVCEWRARVPVVPSVPREPTVPTVPTILEATREVRQIEQNRTQDQSQTQDQSRNHNQDQIQHHGRDQDQNDYDFQFREQTQRQEPKVCKDDDRCGERSGADRKGGLRSVVGRIADIRLKS